MQHGACHRWSRLAYFRFSSGTGHPKLTRSSPSVPTRTRSLKTRSAHSPAANATMMLTPTDPSARHKIPPSPAVFFSGADSGSVKRSHQEFRVRAVSGLNTHRMSGWPRVVLETRPAGFKFSAPAIATVSKQPAMHNGIGRSDLRSRSSFDSHAAWKNARPNCKTSIAWKGCLQLIQPSAHTALEPESRSVHD